MGEEILIAEQEHSCPHTFVKLQSSGWQTPQASLSTQPEDTKAAPITAPAWTNCRKQGEEHGTHM